MKLGMPGLRGTLGTLVVMAAAAGVTYGALTLAGVGGGRAQALAVDLVPGILGTSNRDHLAICVRGVGVSAAEEAAVTAAVEAALPKLAENPAWWKAAAGLPPPTVDNDCAARPAVYDPQAWAGGVQPGSLSDPALFGRVVSLPDAHRLVVYILSADEMARIGADQMPFSHEEVVCPTDQCYDVTTGVYVTSATGADEMGRRIQEALGLQTGRP